MIDMKNTGKVIKKKAESKGYSARTLSEEMGLSITAVYSWFNGNKIPSVDNLCYLGKILECKIDELIVRDI